MVWLSRKRCPLLRSSGAAPRGSGSPPLSSAHAPPRGVLFAVAAHHAVAGLVGLQQRDGARLAERQEAEMRGAGYARRSASSPSADARRDSRIPAPPGSARSPLPAAITSTGTVNAARLLGSKPRARPRSSATTAPTAAVAEIAAKCLAPPQRLAPRPCRGRRCRRRACCVPGNRHRIAPGRTARRRARSPSSRRANGRSRRHCRARRARTTPDPRSGSR